MAYTITQMITQAQAGGAVEVLKVASHNDAVIDIGGRSIILSEEYKTRTVTNGVNTQVTSDIARLDLGTLFTANDVLSSTSLKKAMTDGLVTTDAGTVALSRTAVI